MADIKEKVENELKTVKSMCETIEAAIKTHIDKGLDKVDTHELYEAVDIYKDLSEVKKNIIEGCYKMQIMKAMEEAGESEDYIEDEDMRYYRGQPRSRSGRFMSRGDGRRSNRGRRGFEEEPMPYIMTPEMYHRYPAEYYRDMDRNDGRMYFPTGGNSSGSGGYSDGYSDGENTGYENGNRDGYMRGYSEGQRQGRSEGQRSGQRDSREGRSGQSRRSYMESKEMHTDNSTESKQAKMKELEKYMGELSGDITEMISGASPEEKSMLKTKLATLQQKIN